MKKNIVVFFFSTLLLVGCDYSKPRPSENHTDTDSNTADSQKTEQVVSDSGNSSVSPDKLSMSNINAYISDSKPTMVSYSCAYTYPSPKVTLKDKATLQVEYADEMKGKLVYTHQYLNDISADSMISETTTVSYLKGNKYGVLEDGNIKWSDRTASSFTLTKFNVNERYFESCKIDSENNSFSGTIKDSYVDNFLGVMASVSALKIELNFDDNNKLESLSSSFKTEKNAYVVVSSLYSYNPVSIDIPQ